jgi:hypothetical protein
MSARLWLSAVVVLCGALTVTGADAAAAKKKAAAKAPPPAADAAAAPKKKAVAKAPAPVAAGCTKAIPPFCVGVTSGKATYALFDTNPWIPPGTGVTVWGTVSGISPCGTAIYVTSWKKNKLKCKA